MRDNGSAGDTALERQADDRPDSALGGLGLVCARLVTEALCKWSDEDRRMDLLLLNHCLGTLRGQGLAELALRGLDLLEAGRVSEGFACWERVLALDTRHEFVTRLLRQALLAHCVHPGACRSGVLPEPLGDPALLPPNLAALLAFLCYECGLELAGHRVLEHVDWRWVHNMDLFLDLATIATCHRLADVASRMVTAIEKRDPEVLASTHYLHLMLGEMSFGIGRVDQARKHFLFYLGQPVSPNHSMLCRIANGLAMTGGRNEAVELVRKAEEAARRKGEFQGMVGAGIAESYVNAGDLARAREIFETLPLETFQTSDLLYRMALNCMRCQAYAKAGEMVRAMLDMVDRHDDGVLTRAYYWARLEDRLPEAERMFDQQIALQPNMEIFRFWKAHLLADMGRFDEARELMDGLGGVERRLFYRLDIIRAIAALSEGDLEGGLAWLDKAAAASSRPDVQMQWDWCMALLSGLALLELGRADEALARLEQGAARQRAPGNPCALTGEFFFRLRAGENLGGLGERCLDEVSAASSAYYFGFFGLPWLYLLAAVSLARSGQEGVAGRVVREGLLECRILPAGLRQSMGRLLRGGLDWRDEAFGALLCRAFDPHGGPAGFWKAVVGRMLSLARAGGAL